MMRNMCAQHRWMVVGQVPLFGYRRPITNSVFAGYPHPSLREIIKKMPGRSVQTCLSCTMLWMGILVRCRRRLFALILCGMRCKKFSAILSDAPLWKRRLRLDSPKTDVAIPDMLCGTAFCGGGILTITVRSDMPHRGHLSGALTTTFAVAVLAAFHVVILRTGVR